MDSSEPKILYEDKEVVAIDKPAGLLVHKTSVGGKEKNLAEWLVKKYPEIKKVGDSPLVRPGIVHRLDKNTSGVIVVARTQKAFDYLKKQFQEKGVEKKYIALTWGLVKNESGTIEKPIFLKPGTTKRTVHGGKMEKPAITEYKTIERFEYAEKSMPAHHKGFSLLEVFPKTGRTHQIRVHLASIGHPVVGDSLYGPKTNPLKLGRQFLHASSIKFKAEKGALIEIESHLPDDLIEALSILPSFRQ